MNSRGASQLTPFCGFCFRREFVYSTTVDALPKLEDIWLATPAEAMQHQHPFQGTWLGGEE